MTRSLTDEDWGDPERGIIGKGTLTVSRHISKGKDQRIVRLVPRGETEAKFQAIVHDSKRNLVHMRIDKNELYTLEWDCYLHDGEGYKPWLRSVKIRFSTQGDLATFIMACYRLNNFVMQEFFTLGSRFYPVKATLPPHYQRGPGIPAVGVPLERRRRPLTVQEEVEEYGLEANIDSQDW